MSHLYPDPEQSVTCVVPHEGSPAKPCSSLGQSDEQQREQQHPEGISCGLNQANNSSDSSVVEARRQLTTNANAAGAGVTCTAAVLAERVGTFGCPERATVVQQTLWRPHCIRYTADARLHAHLHVAPDDIIVRKGWQPFIDSFSAFEDNGKLQSTGLGSLLRQAGISRVVIAGVALDYCVLWTALDAVADGFTTALALDATLPVSEAGAADAVQQLQRAGVQVVRDSRRLYGSATPQ